MIKYVRRFLWWLLGVDKMLAMFFQETESFASGREHYVISRINEVVERCFKARKEPVYVTLRGFYIDREGKAAAHGWTKRVDMKAGDACSLAFNPYNTFRCERVDLLGPAEITGVQVGNFVQESPGYANPATFTFEAICEVGVCIVVYLKSTL